MTNLATPPPPWWHFHPDPGRDTFHWIDNATQELDRLTTALAAERAEVGRLKHPPCAVCGNEERHNGTGTLTCECPDPAVTRALQAERERDEARAESERMRTALETAHAALKAVRLACNSEPAMQNRDKYLDLGIQVVNAMNKADLP